MDHVGFIVHESHQKIARLWLLVGLRLHRTPEALSWIRGASYANIRRHPLRHARTFAPRLVLSFSPPVQPGPALLCLYLALLYRSIYMLLFSSIMV